MKAATVNPSAYPATAQSPFEQSPGLVIAAQAVLQQGLCLLQEVDEKYSTVAASPFEASIGQHYRHVLEHFQCLLQGAASDVVNYDSRQRNPRIETETGYAGATTHELLLQIENWTENTLQQRCTTVSTVAYHSDIPSSIASNLGRELAYCIGHAIHHYAIIRLLCSHLKVAVPAEFGYAPSTLKFQSKSAAD